MREKGPVRSEPGFIAFFNRRTPSPTRRRPGSNTSLEMRTEASVQSGRRKLRALSLPFLGQPQDSIVWERSAGHRLPLSLGFAFPFWEGTWQADKVHFRRKDLPRLWALYRIKRKPSWFLSWFPILPLSNVPYSFVCYSCPRSISQLFSLCSIESTESLCVSASVSESPCNTTQLHHCRAPVDFVKNPRCGRASNAIHPITRHVLDIPYLHHSICSPICPLADRRVSWIFCPKPPIAGHTISYSLILACSSYKPWVPRVLAFESRYIDAELTTPPALRP